MTAAPVAHRGWLVDTLTGEVLRRLNTARYCLDCHSIVQRNGSKGRWPKRCEPCTATHRRDVNRASMARTRGLGREIRADIAADPELWADRHGLVDEFAAPAGIADGTDVGELYQSFGNPDGLPPISLDYAPVKFGDYRTYDPAEHMPRVTSHHFLADAKRAAAGHPGHVAVCLEPAVEKARQPDPAGWYDPAGPDEGSSTYFRDVAAGCRRHAVAVGLDPWLAEHPTWARNLTTDACAETLTSRGVEHLDRLAA